MANLRKGVLEKVENFLSSQKYNYEVIIVDDGSKDGSVEFIERFTAKHPQFKILKNSHTGKAGAVTAGVLDSKGDYILFTDMDQATPIEEVDKLLPYFKPGTGGGFDVVIGSRSNRRKGSPLIRRFVSKAAVVMRKVIVGMGEISDTQCGFKAFSKEAAHTLFERVSILNNGFKQISGSSVAAGFDMELLYLAKKMGYKIKEVPIEWLYVETRRVSPLSDSIDGVLDLIRIKKNSMQGKYNI